MANNIFDAQYLDNVIFDEAAIRALPVSETVLLRRFIVTFFKQEANRLAKEKLSPIVGPKDRANHRPAAQPGRTGNYEKNFRVSTVYFGEGISVVFSNTSPYASVVEIGTNRTNYRIPNSRAAVLKGSPRYNANLRFFHYGLQQWMYVDKNKGVIHPGPWRSGTANSNGRAGVSALGEQQGFGSYILNEASRKTLFLAQRRAEEAVLAKVAAERL